MNSSAKRTAIREAEQRLRAARVSYRRELAAVFSPGTPVRVGRARWVGVVGDLAVTSEGDIVRVPVETKDGVMLAVPVEDLALAD